MKVQFSKYHGAGNDFIIIDNREDKIKLDDGQRQTMCDRHFGIGADGILEIRSSNEADFKLIYYNSDGRQGSLCGNGSRCAVAFALKIGVKQKNPPGTAVVELDGVVKKGEENSHETNIDSGIHQPDTYTIDSNCVNERQGNCEKDTDEDDTKHFFEAYDGVHVGGFEKGCRGDDNSCRYFVDMKDVKLDDVRTYTCDSMYIYNGSPHHVVFVHSRIQEVEVTQQGRQISHEVYGKEGCNVSFVAQEGDIVKSSQGGAMKDRDVEETGENAGQLIDENHEILKESVHSDAGSAHVAQKSRQLNSDKDTDDDFLVVRTYERGVNNETLACGTGCVAVAIADYIRQKTAEVHHKLQNTRAAINESLNQSNKHVNFELENTHKEPDRRSPNASGDINSQMHTRRIKMPGGNLLVRFKVNSYQDPSGNVATVFSDITLSGPVQHVFDGVYLI